MQIVVKKIKDLKPYGNNPRFNENAISAVANSIKEFGFINPIVIDKNNVVVCGHTRLKAAERLGLEEAPTIMLENLSEEQINAFRLADNKTAELADWDERKLYEELKAIEEIDMGLFGFDDDIYFEDEKPVYEDIQEEPEPDKEEPTRTHPGEIWKLGEHRLMVGSSIIKENVNKLFKGEIADLIFTDPPYNVDYGEKNMYLVEHNKSNKTIRDYIRNDAMTEEEFTKFLSKAFKNAKNHTKMGGAYYIFYASNSNIEFQQALIENDMKPREQLIWIKNSLVLGRQDYQWIHETIYYGWINGDGHYFRNDRTQTTVYDKDLDLEKLSREDLIKLIKKARTEEQGASILYQDKPVRNDDHPTMKPVDLCAKLIRNSTKEGEIVYDCFAGSGTSLIAAEQTGRKCYAMEIEPRYCDVIIKRWEDLTGKKAEKEQ